MDYTKLAWTLIALALAAGIIGVTISSIDFVAVNHGERYITTVHAEIAHPSSYAGVPIDFAYFYKKDEYQLRVVITLPAGYPGGDGLGGGIDTAYFDAVAILPEWAAHTDPRAVTSSDPTYNSFEITAFGDYMLIAADEIAFMPNYMEIDNNPETVGYWILEQPNYPFDGSDNFVDFTGIDTWLGNTHCDSDFTDTTCLEYFIGQVTTRFSAPVDRKAWGDKYDAAVR